MFELGIFCVLLLAAGYWAMMWTIGRRDDVLHGKFVEAEPETEPEAEQLDWLGTQLARARSCTSRCS